MKLCIDCKHYQAASPMSFSRCTAMPNINPVDGSPMPRYCNYARADTTFCGPEGKLFSGGGDAALDRLIATYAEWQKEQGLKLGSADEHLSDPRLTTEQRAWLERFCDRWDSAYEPGVNTFKPVVDAP